MKTLFTIFLVVFLYNYSVATILTVCPTTSFPAQYSTIQSAIDAAAVDDTIYIYAGIYNEVMYINKKLVIIGPGINPQRPTNLNANVLGITLTGPGASGSVIMGLYVPGSVVFGYDGAQMSNNILVTECLFYGSVQFSGYGNMVENCIFSNHYPDGTTLAFNYPNAIGNVVQNSYIHGMVFVRPGTNTILRNNIFASGDAGTRSFGILNTGQTWGSTVTIENNIFFKSNPNGPDGSTDACAFKNNIYYLTNYPPPTNAFSSGNMNADPQFVNYPAGGAPFSFAFDFKLQPTSPCVNYGTDGNDIGMWDGPAPVNKGFEPPIPRVYGLDLNNSIAPAGSSLLLTIKATKAQ